MSRPDRLRSAMKGASRGNELMSELGPLGAAVLESIFDGVVTADAKGRITHVNPAAALLMEWDAHPPIGSFLSDVFPVDLYAPRRPASCP